MTHRIGIQTALTLAACLAFAHAVAGEVSSPNPVTILEADTHTYGSRWRLEPGAVRTTWRYWETWQTEAVKTESGELVRVDPFKPFTAANGADGKKALTLRPAKAVTGSDFPAEDWQKPDFDDSNWYRHEVAMREGYRSMALMCVRGKFDVPDPSKAGELTLNVGFQGGLVAYVNGKEVGRCGMPEGAIKLDTLAESYPKDSYVNKEDVLLAGDNGKDPDIKARYASRNRTLDVKIPSSVLRKGVNVLALEVHRAPAHEAMIKNVLKTHQWEYTLRGAPNPSYWCYGDGSWWNRLSLNEIKLTAPAGTTGVQPNISRPKGLQVWNESSFKLVSPLQFGDPNETLQPVRLRGVRNGTSSAVLVVGSSDAIKGLKVSVTDLSAGAGVSIPAAAIGVRYAAWENGDKEEWQYESLDEFPPEEIPVMKAMGNQGMAGVTGAVQPVWFVVQVPRDAKPGSYTGKITIQAEGAKPVETQIQLRIAGDWVAPNPQESAMHVGMLESPDSIAMQYNVPLWSEAHWKLLDRTFELMGQMGNKELYVSLIARTQLGNEQSMVRWLKQADGSYQYDYSVAEKYIDIALNRCGKINMVCLYLSDTGFMVKDVPPTEVTEFDASTKSVKALAAPKWGTPESKAFWKPVIEGMQAVLAKRGLQDAAMFGMAVNSGVASETVSDLKALFPKIKWADCTHLWFSTQVGKRDDSQKIGRLATAGGAPLGVTWDPDEDPPHYNWLPNPKDDRILVAGPRGKCTPYLHSALAHYRLTCETTMLSAYAWFSGFGEVGADFFPVLKSAEGALKDRPGKRLDNRYVYWGSLNLASMVNVMLGCGTRYPVHTARSQMFRESLQEYNARVYVQNALLNESQKSALGPELAAECKKVCDDRTRTLRYCSYFFAPSEHYLDFGRLFNHEQWEVQTEQLYVAAGRVAKVLGK